MLLLVVAVLIGCGGSVAEDAAEPTPIVTVRTAPVRSMSVEDSAVVSGQTVAGRSETLVSPSAGQVEGQRWAPGDAVQSGAVLLRILTRESAATLAGARTLRAEASTPEARAAAESAVRLAQANLATMTVRAPFSGFVQSVAVGPGSAVSEGGELLTVVGDVRFEAVLPVAIAARIRPGQRVKLNLTGDERERSGTIQMLLPEADPTTGATRARLTVSGPTPPVGALGTATLVLPRAKDAPKVSVAVPTEAILVDDETGERSIVLVGADSLAHLTTVQIGPSSGGYTAVVSPQLVPGTAVVIEGAYALPDSVRVRLAPGSGGTLTGETP